MKRCRLLSYLFWGYVLLSSGVMGCSSSEMQDSDASIDHSIIADQQEADLVADLAEDIEALPDSSSDQYQYPNGFTRALDHEPSGLLCNIPADYIQKGGDPVYPNCPIGVGHYSDRDLSYTSTTIRVATWNIEFGKHSYALKDALTTDPILKDIDIFLLQEVSRLDKKSNPENIDQIKDLAQLLEMNYAFGVEWDRRENDSEGGEHGVAILTKYPIGNVKLIRHTPLWDFWLEKKHYGGRMTLAADLLINDERVRVYAIHLSTRDYTGDGRALQGAEVRADAELIGQPKRQIAGGDFNTFLCNPKLFDCYEPPQAEKVIRDFLSAGWIDMAPKYDDWTQKGLSVFPQRLDWIYAKGFNSISYQVPHSLDEIADHVPIISTIEMDASF